MKIAISAMGTALALGRPDGRSRRPFGAMRRMEATAFGCGTAQWSRFLGALVQSVLTIGLLVSNESWAQTRCRCSSSEWVGKCTATISQERNWITVKTTTPRCARVDWYADEHPRVTIVMDGSDIEEWLGPTPRPRLSITDCNVCLDAKIPRDTAPGAGSPVASDEPISSKEGYLQMLAELWKARPPNESECADAARSAEAEPRFNQYSQQCKAALDRHRRCARYIRQHLTDQAWRQDALIADCYLTGDPERIVRDYLDPGRTKTEMGVAIDELVRQQEARRRDAEALGASIRRKIEEERIARELALEAARRQATSALPPSTGAAPPPSDPVPVGDDAADRSTMILQNFLAGMAQGWLGARSGAGAAAGAAAARSACSDVARQIQEYQRGIRQLDASHDSHRQMLALYQRGVAENSAWMRQNCR